MLKICAYILLTLPSLAFKAFYVLIFEQQRLIVVIGHVLIKMRVHEYNYDIMILINFEFLVDLHTFVIKLLISQFFLIRPITVYV